jgi:poly-gamma-glutamate synthesis protein (capsule biosynthesis protein)
MRLPNWSADGPMHASSISKRLLRAAEVYRRKLVLYGCGDFLNDYEGISGHESYRGDLALMYFVNVDPLTGNLSSLHMSPMQISRFRLNRVSEDDALWLEDILNREGKKFGTQVELEADNTLVLRWSGQDGGG